jgi:phthiocerol/phenolphthiocerol synthesis type-I polyketide synthase E
MSIETDVEQAGGGTEIAVVGMAGRFPGAPTVREFWSNLRAGVESITFFGDDELRAAGVDDETLAHPDYVKGYGALGDVAGFDAAFFGYSPREAELLEPAHRIFLECAWEAMEDAGYDPSRVDGAVGVYAGAGSPAYTDRNVRGNPELAASAGEFQLLVGSGKDFLSTRASYKLDLRGPSVNVQTGCSTALVAVHMACQSLLSRECDVAMAGGASVPVPQTTGYLWSHGGILSPDGHCRAFDADSAGAQAGSGVGVVVLKRLDDALADGDVVHAVIKGSAINNDGAVKVAYTAPSVEGQSAVIGEALAVADVDPSTITYVEAHGTGTELGDPIEIAALNRAFRGSTDAERFCVVGSVKTNIGHLDTAAGIAGLIKTVLALKHRELPPTLHYRSPNPRIDFAGSPFYVSGELMAWNPPAGVPRRAGVSSFGIGGTNAHVILEEAPAATPSEPSEPWQLLALSARTPAALDAATANLAAHLRENPSLEPADVAWTLQQGRRAFAVRRTVAVHRDEDAAAVLEARTPDRVATGGVEGGHKSVAFMFPGVGEQYVNMARGLYEQEPAFRAEVDRCAAILRPHLGFDLREVLYPGPAPEEPGAPAARAGGFDLRRMLGREAGPADAAAERLNRTEVAQPAVFVVEWALAKLWMSLGVQPEALIGHSLGEYVAATVAGVFTLEEALALVAERARMIQALPGGAMLAVSAAPDAVRPFLGDAVQLATVNAPQLCVVSGPDADVARVEESLAGAGTVSRRVPTTHAFHSAMMEPVVGRFVERVSAIRLRRPEIPFVSNVTGTWITPEQATDPRYWGRHLRETVQFEAGAAELLREPGRVLLEVGPGQTLSTFVRQRDDAQAAAVVPTVRYPYDRQADRAFLLSALGRLWVAGVEPEWKAVHGGQERRRVQLPTYPWERQRYWVEAPTRESLARAFGPARGKRRDPADWFHLPTWKSTPAPAPAADADARWIVFAGDDALSAATTDALRAAAAHVTVVRPGTVFRREGAEFTIRPDARDDYRELMDALGAVEGRTAVAHLWSVDGPAQQTRGFLSLALLADALGHDREHAARIVAASSGLFDVTGDERLEPARATLLAACRNVPHEYPHLTLRAVDVHPSGDAASVARRLAAELLSGSEETAVALRGRHRWTREFAPVRPVSTTAPRLRQGGVYLLTHGLGGRNKVIARTLVERYGARLAVLDRVIPARGAWDVVIETRPEGDEIRSQIELVRELEAAGGEILFLPALLTRADELEEGFQQAERKLGPVNGVFHAVPDEVLANFSALSELRAAVWQARAGEAMQELETLERVLESRAPDFVLLESSLASALGGVGLGEVAALNHLAEAFAHRHATAHATPWTAVGWDRWGSADDGLGEYFLTTAEAAAALELVLAFGGEPQVMVSSGDLGARVGDAAQAPVRRAQAVGSVYARPELSTEYFPPTSETEERMEAMWAELLGIDRIGIHDDFFHLGGHSLLATQIVSRVREMFALELPLKAIFEAPTVAKFAALVEEAIIAEIDELTDEEAMQLL